VQSAIRRIQFPAASILHGLHQSLGGIAHVVLKVRVAVEIVVSLVIRLAPMRTVGLLRDR
jgi:hypothetical protein